MGSRIGLNEKLEMRNGGAASLRLYMGRCPKVSWETGFPFERFCHDSFDRE